MGSSPHGARPFPGAYYLGMKSSLASTLLPPMTADAADIRIAIDRLESEAPTHDDQHDASETVRSVVPSVGCIRRII